MAETQDWSAPLPSPVLALSEQVLHASETVSQQATIAGVAGQRIVLVALTLRFDFGAPSTEFPRALALVTAIGHTSGTTVAAAEISPGAPYCAAVIPYGGAELASGEQLDLWAASQQGAGTQQVVTDLWYYLTAA